MNFHDSERIAGLLESRGYRAAESPETADLVVFNTCAVREHAGDRLYGHLGHLASLKRERPEFRIAVGGCQAQMDRERLLVKASHVDVVFGTHNLASLPDLLERVELTGRPQAEILEETEAFPSCLPSKRERSFRAWVTVSKGCDNTCTFCVVPALRGPETSRRPEEVLAEIEGLVADGVVEVTLLGQNVNSYGHDLSGRVKFSDLLRSLGGAEGLRRVRFTSPHPKDFPEETIRAIAETPNVCEHVHLPLQSGSDEVLRAMRRSYRAQRYLRLVESLRNAVPDLALTTDLIVGFPGETERDFADTLRVVEASRFDAAYTFIYSPRPGTPAASMNNQVAPGVIQERFARLVELVERLGLEANRPLVGRIFEVLVEEVSIKNPDRLSGRTRSNKLVHFPKRDGIGAGGFVQVRIDRATPHYLVGEAVERGRNPEGTASGEAVDRGRNPEGTASGEAGAAAVSAGEVSR